MTIHVDHRPLVPATNDNTWPRAYTLDWTSPTPLSTVALSTSPPVRRLVREAPTTQRIRPATVALPPLRPMSTTPPVRRLRPPVLPCAGPLLPPIWAPLLPPPAWPSMLPLLRPARPTRRHRPARYKTRSVGPSQSTRYSLRGPPAGVQCNSTQHKRHR